MSRSTITKSLLLSLLAVMLVTAPVLAYTYRAAFVVTEDNGTAYTMFPAMVDADNEWMADNDFFETDTLDTRVETLGGLVKPHMVATDRTLTATAIPANSQTNLYFTTGNVDLTSVDIITGYKGFNTITDVAGLEPTNNFGFEFTDTWLDTSAGTDRRLLYKEDAVVVGVSGPGGKAYARIHSYTAQEAQAVNGGVTEDLWGVNWVAQTFTTTAEYRIASWFVFREAPVGAPPGNMICSIRATAAGVPTGADLVSAHILADGGAAAVYFYSDEVVTLANGTTYAMVCRVPDGDNANKVQLDENNTNPYAGGQMCTSGDSGDTWAGVGGSDLRFTTYLGAIVDATVASGEHDILVTADTVDLEISVDGAVAGAGYDTTPLAGATVPGNANNWILMDNSTTQFMPYMGVYEHSVGGALVTRYQPNDMIVNTGESGTADAGTQTTLDDAILTQANDYWNGARLIILTTTDTFAPQGETSVVTDFDAANDRLTFDTLTAVVDAGDTYTIDFATLPDREVAGNDARITWGADPTGISTSLGGMVSSSQPTPGLSEEDVTLDILPDIGVSDWFVEPAVAGALLTNPIRPFVTILSDSTTLTELQAWRISGLAFVLFVTVAVAAAVRSHLLITGIAAAASIGACCALTVFPLWALVFAIGAVLGGLVAERSPSL